MGAQQRDGSGEAASSIPAVLRRLPIAQLKSRQRAYLLAVDAVAVAWMVLVLAHAHIGVRGVGVLALLIVIALGFEEGARRAARLQIRISADLKRDMVSVWAVAGAVALRGGVGLLLLLTVVCYVRLRQQRPAGHALFRSWFTASTEILGMLLAGEIIATQDQHWSGLPLALPGAVSVAVAIVVYAVVNRALVTVALLFQDVRGRDLLGTLEDNLIELATLCLGGFVALAVLYQPWLCLLVLAPMVTLQRGALVRELEKAASMDTKTGLLNAVAWEHVAQRELTRADREGYAVAVLIVDIDRFKRVNDQHGHLIGDAVLHAVGRTIAASVREYDSVGRFGGEEFVVLLPDADTRTAITVAERVRQTVGDLRISRIAASVPVSEDDALSVSVGVSSAAAGEIAPPFDALVAGLLSSADAALYRAKAAGRNLVVLAGDGPAEPWADHAQQR